MLYNKRAVKQWVRPGPAAYDLAKAEGPFTLPPSSLDEHPWMNIDPKEKGGDEFRKGFFARIFHDVVHSYEGPRKTDTTILEGMGDCFEIGALIWNILSLQGYRPSCWVFKNPSGYVLNKSEIGVHPFLFFPAGKKALDPCHVYIQPIKKVEGDARVHVTKREFTAMWMQLGAEDLSGHHDKHDDALHLLRLAKIVDPNNYTLDHTEGDVLWNKEECDLAGRAYRRVVRKAPGIIDGYVELAQYYTEMGDEEEAIRTLKHAEGKGSGDRSYREKASSLLQRLEVRSSADRMNNLLKALASP